MGVNFRREMARRSKSLSGVFGTKTLRIFEEIGYKTNSTNGDANFELINPFTVNLNERLTNVYHSNAPDDNNRDSDSDTLSALDEKLPGEDEYLQKFDREITSNEWPTLDSQIHPLEIGGNLPAEVFGQDVFDENPQSNKKQKTGENEFSIFDGIEFDESGNVL